MSGSPIPQLVNISHALQSSFVQKLRSEVKAFSETPRLTEQQTEQIDQYITSLETAFAEFTRDNEHIERREAHVTAADVQLYSGLKTMYADYLSQLVKLKQRSVSQEEHVSGECPVDYVCDELPYKQPSERKAYVDKLLAESGPDSYANATQLAKNDQLLDGITNLAVLDSTIAANIQAYSALLRKIGFSETEISSHMPHYGNGHSAPENSVTTKIEPSSVPSSLASKAQETTPNTVPEPSKKKISFSKYLKKGDYNDTTLKRGSEEDGGSSSPSTTKRLKTEDSPTAASNSAIASILKSHSNKKKRNPIRFVSDEKLLTVYGDELPTKGLIVSPSKLKKVLKPFKDGEPREITYSAWNGQKVQELSFPKPNQDSDIVDTRGGLVPCETRVPLGYRLNFTTFSKALTKMPSEPTELDDTDPSLSQKPLIVRAFGKNCLLLQKDRGGIPYKRVPEVGVNDYPIRPAST
ncbi:LAME_0E03532g1_1 [Lachancea meyersii CBS 8951]|uniref:LAME_0E03532g1_1 n=1 Tax=Lachancea meyersii CBS 8951 TaxID=1266667 RepID=A0A1G4JGI4_9SACH|nr:LAME_0E03532g1_1 [Lachancea meyersii CBS 8951]